MLDLVKKYGLVRVDKDTWMSDKYILSKNVSDILFQILGFNCALANPEMLKSDKLKEQVKNARGVKIIKKTKTFLFVKVDTRLFNKIITDIEYK